MPEINVAWTWKSVSPLHIGSGLSRPGVADSLVRRDSDGRPVIHGEAVKGALRMSAEQVASWLDKPQKSGPRSPAKPVSWPFARVFGGGAAARCTPATTVDAEESRAAMVISATAVDSTTGTALDGTLRKTEFVPPGSKFKACYTVAVSEVEVDIVETLLLTALVAVDSVGGKAGVGWGRMILENVTVTFGDDERCPAKAVSTKRLENLKCALGANIGEAATTVEPPQAAQPKSCKWFQLTIELREPATLSGQPEVSNKVMTHDWIPATTLRGALAGYWRHKGKTQSEISSFLSRTTLWTPGFRMVCNALVLPAPRSFITTKRPAGGYQPMHNSFSGPAPKREVQDSAGPADAEELQWRPVGAASMQWRDGRAMLAGSGGLREIHMHMARDYRTGGKREGVLYARESLVPGTLFRAWARLPEDAFEDTEKPVLFIGKRVSAGNGRATLKVEKNIPPNTAFDSFTPNPLTEMEQADATGADCAVIVHLLTPALVYDELGHPLRTLDADWWQAEFKSSHSSGIEGVGAFTGTGRQGAWMSSWGHARAAVGTIEAGSVWRLGCRSKKDASGLRKKLKDRAYIGERVHEGFGWIAVDPPWLYARPAERLPLKQTAPPEAAGAWMPWPGIDVEPCALAKTARCLASSKPPDRAGAGLREVAARARATEVKDENEFEDCLNYLKDLCKHRAEKRKEKWDPVMEVVDRKWSSYGELLFALDILAKRAGREAGSGG